MINRAALLVYPSEPFLAWARSIDDDIAPAKCDERTVYLIPEFDDDRGFERVLKKVWSEVFERELEAWYIDETRWPQNRTYSMFKKWFRIEYHTIIEDLCSEPLEDDECSYCDSVE